MNSFKNRRYQQFLRYGWKDAKNIAEEIGGKRFSIFFDIVTAYRKYHLFSNQFRQERFWELSASERQEVGSRLGSENKRRDRWVEENYHNWQFLNKWTNMRYNNTPPL